MRMISCLALVVVMACSGANKVAPTEATSPPTADEPAEESKPGRYCTADGLCYDDVKRADYASDDELMCEQYCTAYCACYEEVEGDECHDGGGCTVACEQDLKSDGERGEWLRRLRCGQEADCKRFLDEC